MVSQWNEGLLDQLVTCGRQVLQTEADALIRASIKLDDAFLAAVKMIFQVEGKVIVTGLGKSGHVGRKIAATLASTGTPSFFLHPAEALHGDLGVLSDKDCLLAIAFGGETHETLEVAAYARRQNIPSIALTGRLNSRLARAVDVVLDGSVDREACPLNLAPTSSTTLAMALGDSLAVALMRARGFAEEDFAQVHPGGSLGRRLSLVSDHMRKDMPVLRGDDGFHRILEVVTAQNYGIAAVVENGQLIGAISDGDLRRALIRSEAAVFQLTALDLMNAKPKTITSQHLAMDAVRYMEQHSIGTLFVLDPSSSEISGLVRMYDLLQAKVV